MIPGLPMPGMPSAKPTHLAIPIDQAQKLAAFFFETAMPRTQSDPYVQILQSAVPVMLPPPQQPDKTPSLVTPPVEKPAEEE